MPKLTQKQIFIFGGAALAVIVVLVLIFTNLKSDATPADVTLTMWGTASKDAINAAVAPYIALHKNVKLDYQQFAEATYEGKVIDALAGGQGPDIFMIGNHELLKFANKISPAPATTITPAKIDELFPQVVGEDFTHG